MNIRALCFVFVLWGMTSQLKAGDLVFQLSRKVKTQPSQQEELVSVTLDSDVFEATRNGFPDMRLLDSEGNQVAYLLRKVQTTPAETTRETWPTRQPSTGDKKREYTVTGFQIDREPETQQTIILVDTRREPLTSLTLETPGKNFSRHAVVEVEEKAGVQSSWHTIGTGTLFRIDFKNLKREQLSISFPESRQARYRIVIENRDSPALDVTGITTEGPVYELLFLAAPDKPYQLMYGAADVEPASYDTAAIRALLQEGFQPAKAELGKQTASGQVPAFQWSGLLNDRRLLIGVIALLVAALGWGLFHAVKRMDDMPKAP